MDAAGAAALQQAERTTILQALQALPSASAVAPLFF
jgi:hypothetical protein